MRQGHILPYATAFPQPRRPWALFVGDVDTSIDEGEIADLRANGQGRLGAGPRPLVTG